MSSVGPGESNFLIYPGFVCLKLQEHRRVVADPKKCGHVCSTQSVTRLAPLLLLLLLVVAHPGRADC